ncbi:MAG: glycosyltransferase family 2 protein [Vicinamibacterales bacterium]
MLTVLMATRNGEDTLQVTLDAFTRLASPAGGWKLLLVDNGSTDRTPQIAAAFDRRLPLTYLWEGGVGKNVALNAGLSHAEGDLIVFTDDDVVPRMDWLVRLREAADNHPAFSMFGGAIVARWEQPPPGWLRWLDHGHLFSVTNPQLREGPVQPETIFGPNMAVRAGVFDAGARFDTSIGPRGSSYAMGSETELVQRLGWQGLRAWHAEHAVVEHIVRGYQMSRAWVAGRAVRFGRGMYRLQRLEQSGTPLLPWTTLMMLKCARRVLRIGRARLTGDERALCTARWELNYFRGLMMEAGLRSRERHVAPAGFAKKAIG